MFCSCKLLLDLIAGRANSAKYVRCLAAFGSTGGASGAHHVHRIDDTGSASCRLIMSHAPGPPGRSPRLHACMRPPEDLSPISSSPSIRSHPIWPGPYAQFSRSPEAHVLHSKIHGRRSLDRSISLDATSFNDVPGQLPLAGPRSGGPRHPKLGGRGAGSAGARSIVETGSGILGSLQVNPV